jgi:hypothetical protein
MRCVAEGTIDNRSLGEAEIQLSVESMAETRERKSVTCVIEMSMNTTMCLFLGTEK